MEKLFLIIFIIFSICFVNNIYAGEVIEDVTVYWDWDGPTPEDSGLPSANQIANDLEWHLYMSNTSGSYGSEPVIVSQYGSNLEMTDTIIIDGIGGETIRMYFVLRAYYDSGESGNSNEIYKDFVIPKDRPLQLRFTVEVE